MLSREYAFGVLVIDWEARTTSWFGMDGCGEDRELTAEEVVDIATKAINDDKTAWCLIFWHEQSQLVVHDVIGFNEEVNLLKDD